MIARGSAKIRFINGVCFVLFFILRRVRFLFHRATRRDIQIFSATRCRECSIEETRCGTARSCVAWRGATRLPDVPPSVSGAPFHPLNYEISHGKFFSQSVRKLGYLPAATWRAALRTTKIDDADFGGRIPFRISLSGA